ncbi:hypothetical protein BGZ97_004659, partial [Linnemannia gamsii]
EFRAENLQDFSLARDGVADLSVGSKFRKSLAPDVGKTATKLARAGELHATWLTLAGILGRVFCKNHYDDVAEAITDESMKDPVARYIIAHYFAFQDHVPTSEYLSNSNEEPQEKTVCILLHVSELARNHRT